MNPSFSEKAPLSGECYSCFSPFVVAMVVTLSYVSWSELQVEEMSLKIWQDGQLVQHVCVGTEKEKPNGQTV